MTLVPLRFPVALVLAPTTFPPPPSTSYTQAVNTLDVECKRMGEEERAYLAVAMANCLLSKSGLPTYRSGIPPCCQTHTYTHCSDPRAATCVSAIAVGIRCLARPLHPPRPRLHPACIACMLVASDLMQEGLEHK